MTTTRQRVVPAGAVRDLREHERRSDYDALIRDLRERVAADRRILTNAWVKQWCGRRWRDLFLAEAVDDPRALRAASRRLALRPTPAAVRLGPDRRPARQRIAERFLYRDVDDWRLELPAPPTLPRPRTSLLFCPGFVNTLVPVPALRPELAALEGELGMKVLRARSHPVRGCAANVADIHDALVRGHGLDATGEPRARPRKPGDVVMLGYSKGAPDALTFLATHPDLASRVRSVVSWAGAVGGSHTADDIHSALVDLPIDLGPATDYIGNLLKALLPIARLDRLLERADEWDLKGALRDLTTTERASFWRRHGSTLDAMDIPFFNVATVSSPLDVPFFQLQGAVDIQRKAGDNDMQVALPHAQVRGPMATTLAVCRAHHWDLAMEAFPSRYRLGSSHLEHPFPRRAAVLATVRLQAELGLID